MNAKMRLIQMLENVSDKDNLQFTLASLAIYIGLYEAFSDMVEGHVESFLCQDCSLNSEGTLAFKSSDLYRAKIKKRIVDEKGNKDILKATMLWFVEEGAITQAEYDNFLILKEYRNSYVHQMCDHILNGLTEDDAKATVQLFELYTKVDKWWINEIEIPIMGELSPDGYDPDDVMSVAAGFFYMMFQTLFGEESQECKDMICDAKNKFGEEPK